ncbi:hypothetical protein CONLIGDRAFT_636074 [Coniochaeta ligniaria NRRL 30616]|uniref:Uncharacterized protein n=1 Tax=Coniochaeta ligniaria NRRL 30616 TaxID=1408157 RepID=A0A1J7J715_9PEZI|nr:hypothetical protein CONLIGDRAFT_636074 [Coniochaeta ligniaria NRRL 30616]
MRNGAELSIMLPTFADDNLETDRVVYALGAVVQKPPHAVSSLPSNVFIHPRASYDQDRAMRIFA